MTNLDDTQPNKPITSLHDTQPQRAVNYPPSYERGLKAPPKILLWGVIFLFVGGMVGSIGGLYVFREVLTPARQEHVMFYFPFMEVFLPPPPPPGGSLAPAAPVDQNAVDALLNNELELPDLPGAADSEATTPTEEPTPTPTNTPTLEPTESVALAVTAAATTVSETPVPTATAQTGSVQTPVPAQPVSSQAWGSTALLGGITHHRQTWNNCGPSNVSMALSFYGWTRGQEYAASYLKPEREDKNVSPHELVDFVNEQSDISALWRVGGDLDLLRTLVYNEFPVIIERSHMFEGYDWIGHYQTIAGYNDNQRVFIIYDSFLGDGDVITESYDEVDSGWKDFNRTFMVVYEPSREDYLMQLLGNRATPLSAAQHAYEVALEEARANPQDAFAWFNMGTSLTMLGSYDAASTAFDRAIEVNVPWRMLWYQFAPYEAYFEVGRYADILSYVEANLGNGGEWVEETYYWQGRAYEAQGETALARTAYRQALNHNRLFDPAKSALDRLNA